MADIQNRARINLNPEDAKRAEALTGKTGVDMVRELINLVENPPIPMTMGKVPNGNSLSVPVPSLLPRAMMNGEQSQANIDFSLERKYWDMIAAKTKAIDAVLNLKTKLSKIEKKEWEQIAETPKRIGQVQNGYGNCYVCGSPDHWSYECPDKFKQH